MRQSDPDAHFMELALAEARRAFAREEVPVGAVIVRDGEVIARAHNATIANRSAVAHAEMLALGDAVRLTGDRYLPDATVYVTLEPCAMCAGALVLARVRRLVFAASDPKAGACGSLYNLCADPRLNHEIEVFAGGPLEEDAAALLRSFFRERRAGRVTP